MDKYTLLIILNVPFVIFGYIKAATMYKSGSTRHVGFILRILFWTLILIGLVFTHEIYNFLNTNKLTDSTPLSLADVVLATGVIFSLFLSMQLYTKVDALEKRLSDLHEKLSINSSIRKS